MSLHLGIDAGTQSIKCLVIDTETGGIAAESTAAFAKDFPEYHSPEGFIPTADALIRHADPMMWVDALELALERLKGSRIDLKKIKSISGSGQQHGSVYLAAPLPAYTGEKKLSDQLRPCLSRPTAPIWMDRSTAEICKDLNRAFGSRIIESTGSPAIERFTGPQIRAFYLREEKAYRNTSKIHLVSSFLCSVLCGAHAPIDYGDGAGMNLLNLHSLNWDQEIAAYTAPDLLEKLPEPVPGGTVAGYLSGYFSRFGLTPGIPVAVWTGDNPGSLIGTGCFEPGTSGISMGTSDTVFMPMKTFCTDPEKYGHVFGNPAGGFMSLICFTNGSLAREKIKDLHHADWTFFDKTACSQTPPGNNGKLMLPYFSPENTPLILAPEVIRNYTSCTAAEDIRAILESQVLAKRLHSQWIPEEIRRIRLTGGASNSPAIQQIIADVFNAEVETLQAANSAALGGAMLAASCSENTPLPELAAMFSRGKTVAVPSSGSHAVYQKMLTAYRELESNYPKYRA